MAILDIDEAAHYLRMCRASLEKLVRAGQVPGTKLVDKWVFSEKQLEQYVEKLSEKNIASYEVIENGDKPPTRGRRRNEIPL